MELFSIAITLMGYVSVISTLVYEKKKYSHEKSKKQAGFIIKILNYLPVIVITPVLMLYIYEYYHLKTFSTLIVSLPLYIRIIGVLLLIFFLYTYSDSILVMKNNWTIGLELRKNHTLVKKHAFRYIRHPIYASWIGIIFSLSLIFSSLLYIISLIPVLIWYSYRAIMEEKFLCQHLPGYKKYSKETKRFIPFIY